MGGEEVFDLHGVDVLAAGDDDVLFAVHQEDEAVLVLLGHIAGEQPAVHQGLGGGFRVPVIAGHEAGAFQAQLAHLAPGHVFALFVHDAGLPAVAGLADGADLVDVLHAQMHRAGADGFGQAVVGVVFVIGEDLLPALDQALGHGLGADVHQPPLGKPVIGQIHLAAFDGVQDILGPGHQQPDDGAFFVGHRLQHVLGLGAFEQHRLAAYQEGAEPVHLGAGVVEGRDAQEDVVVGLAVMGLFHPAGMDEAFVVM